MHKILKLKENIKNLIDKEFQYIIIANMLSSIFVFILSIIIVRFLSKESMGAYSYAKNIYSIAMLFNGLGVNAGIVHFCSSESKIKTINYLNIGLKIGIITNFMILITLLFIGYYIELPVSNANYLLILFSLIAPFVIIFQSQLSYLRAEFQNKLYSLFLALEKFTYLLTAMIFIRIWNIEGIFIARYMVFILVLIFTTHTINRFNRGKNKQSLTKREVHEFISYSTVTVMSTGVAGVLYMIDVFMIGLIVKDAVILADYKTATLLPFALNVIPNSIMIFALPYFSKNMRNKNWLKTNYKKLLSYLFLINVFVTAVLLVFSRQIIQFVFGAQYISAILPFRILSIGYLITASFRIPAGNFIASIRKVKINLINAITISILNIILDIILIYKLGSVGAAISTVSIFILSALLANGYIVTYFRGNK